MLIRSCVSQASRVLHGLSLRHFLAFSWLSFKIAKIPLYLIRLIYPMLHLCCLNRWRVQIRCDQCRIVRCRNIVLRSSILVEIVKVLWWCHRSVLVRTTFHDLKAVWQLSCVLLFRAKWVLIYKYVGSSWPASRSQRWRLGSRMESVQRPQGTLAPFLLSSPDSSVILCQEDGGYKHRHCGKLDCIWARSKRLDIAHLDLAALSTSFGRIRLV